MSHLTILPTVLRDADRLAAVLRARGFDPVPGGSLAGFPPDHQTVVLRVQVGQGLEIGWARQMDGSLALVCDLQRLSRGRRIERLLGEITRAYAARKALEEASGFPATAQIQLSA
ncbi:MAG: DUF1257 domain-containing protein [Cyanobium sp.]